MAQEKSTTVNGKVTNPRDIQFPHDEFGFTTLLRKEGVRAAGRIKGDEQKLKVFISTLKALGEHARAKTEDDNKEIAKRIAADTNRREAEYARSIMDQQREVERLAKMLRGAEAALEAKKAMPDEDTEEGS